jgi:hypothetical protein
MAPCFQNDNGPAERLKLLESLANHKHVQNKIISTVIPDLLSLDVRAPPTAEQVATDADDTATAVAEKRNPMARMLLMRLEKRDMPGVKLFTDVSLNFSKSDYIASAPAVWKDEARFVAANVAAFLYRRFGEVGLSFFLPHIGTQVKDQGWNEEEDRPVTAGEEGLNQVLKPYAKDSPMTKMFDFSKMDDTPLKKDLQNPADAQPRIRQMSLRILIRRSLLFKTLSPWPTGRCSTTQMVLLGSHPVKHMSLSAKILRWAQAWMAMMALSSRMKRWLKRYWRRICLQPA